MDKLLDTFKEKFQAPFLSNYFIGLLLFNRKVIYAALSTDYNDRIGDFYNYHYQQFTSKIELLQAIHAHERNLDMDPSANLLFLPLLYSVIISTALPYLKAVLKTITENADKLNDYLRNKFNDSEIVLKETHITLQNQYSVVLKDKEKLVKELNDVMTKSSKLANALDIKEAGNVDLNQQLSDKNIQIMRINNEYDGLLKQFNDLQTSNNNREKTISDIFSEAIWKLEFKFQNSNRGNGFEYFKILNGYEIHVCTTPNGKYELRAYVDRYDYQINGEKQSDIFNPEGTLLNRFIFKKSFIPRETDPDTIEIADCVYVILNENEISGEENYSFNNGKTFEKSIVVITRYSV